MQEDKIKKVYGLFDEEKSKYIYENRIMYSLTGAKKFIRNVVCTTQIGYELYNRLKLSDRKKVLFGAGRLGQRFVRVYDDIKFDCFVDNYYADSSCGGIPVIDIEELKRNYSDAIICIVSIKYWKEIMEQLLREGFEERNILNFGMEYRKMNQLQYFDLPELEKNRKEWEVFVDGGSYDGESAVNFLKWCKSRGGIYAWEPDRNSIHKCKQLFEEQDMNVELIPKGLWSKAGVLRFRSQGRGGSITANGEMSVEVESIDYFVKEPVTFIKLDVEGAEYQALLGAEHTIASYKPKLAICTYHKLEDIWELPSLIHEMNPEYRFYLRHYSFAENETVLYAMPR